MTQCYVTDADYRKYWLCKPPKTVMASGPKHPTWDGVERRAGAERRIRERREYAAKGRRYRAADRRKRL
jgi:hypothetical protein